MTDAMHESDYAPASTCGVCGARIYRATYSWYDDHGYSGVTDHHMHAPASQNGDLS